MQHVIAKWVSIMASPFIVIPVFGIWVISDFAGSSSEFLLWVGGFLVTILALPFLYIYVGVRRGQFTDLHLAIREQRSTPFLVATLCAFLLLVYYYLINTPREGLVLATALLANGVIFYLVTRYWKASVHSASFFGSVFIASVLVDSRAWFLLIFLPLIIWARTKREKHNLAQTIVSVILVGLSTSAVFYIFKLF